MAELPSLSADEFPQFFTAIHGHQPFPWQTRLAAGLASGGTWPAVLDLPTGTGKTAVLDVAVFQLALQAGRIGRTAPLRIVYVVDRRTIVDQAHERATRIRAAIESNKDGVVGRVGARLASLGRDGEPLCTAVLRGGIARSDSWARSPDQPLIAVSTVDQVGSRLLFRGYGVSDSMKPVHAGLLGNDVLYLLDEVHLSEPFRETLTAIGGRFKGWAERPLPSPFIVVSMSATSGSVVAAAFQLDAADAANPTLSKRLQARKPTRLVSTTGRLFLGELEKQVKPLVQRGATVLVVVNRVATARQLHERLNSDFPAARVALVTGRMRPLDRASLEHDLFPQLRAGRTRDAASTPLVVVATQCIEAGADFDFDVLVTECASLDALRQRFGRLDRLGEMAGTARGVVVARTDTFKDDPVYGDAIGATWNWLDSLDKGTDGTIDFGIGGIAVPSDAMERGLLARKERAPVLLPSHLDSFVQTSPRPVPDPDIALWLHGPARGVADVQIVWRADLDAELLLLAQNDENAAEREIALAVVETLPPASGEALSVPFLAAKRWLSGLAEPEMADVEGAREESSDDDWRTDPDRAPRPAIVWRGDESLVIDGSGATPGDKRLRPGDTIVVPASYGGVAHGTWSPAAAAAVTDVAEVAVLQQRGRATLRMHPAVVAGLFGQVTAPPKPEADGDEAADERKDIQAWLDALAPVTMAPSAAELLEILRKQGRDRRLSIEQVRTTVAGDEVYFVSSRTLTTRRAGLDGAEVTTEDDRASFTGVRVTLNDHLAGVRDIASMFARRVGLPEDLIADVQLAGRWHDVGKVDRRFQQLLNGGSEFKTLVQPEPLAKSAMRLNDRRRRQEAQRRSGYPTGARHELTSVALMVSVEKELQLYAQDWELVLHLVASHHGWCRPFAPCVVDPKPQTISFELDGVASTASSAHGLERLDSGVAERFWRLVRRYGWWGLAWMEAVLRLGDHRRSELEQQSERMS